MTTTRTGKAQTTLDHEQIVAERYRWWGVYLMREKRRLKGIAEAVQAEEAAAALKQQTLPEPGVGDATETPEELLTRVDAELELADALSALEPSQPDETGTEASDHRSAPDDT